MADVKITTLTATHPHGMSKEDLVSEAGVPTVPPGYSLFERDAEGGGGAPTQFGVSAPETPDNVDWSYPTLEAATDAAWREARRGGNESVSR